MDTQWQLRIGEMGEEQVPNPDWQHIQNALIKMDGTTLDEVVLELGGKGSLCVAGGDEGRYLVVYFPANHPDAPSLTLTDLSLTGPHVTLTVQTSAEYAAKYAVKWPVLSQVVDHFFRTGVLRRDVRWELGNRGIE